MGVGPFSCSLGYNLACIQDSARRLVGCLAVAVPLLASILLVSQSFVFAALSQGVVTVVVLGSAGSRVSECPVWRRVLSCCRAAIAVWECVVSPAPRSAARRPAQAVGLLQQRMLGQMVSNLFLAHFFLMIFCSGFILFLALSLVCFGAFDVRVLWWGVSGRMPVPVRPKGVEVLGEDFTGQEVHRMPPSTIVVVLPDCGHACSVTALDRW